MDDDVDLILGEHTQINPAANRFGSAEQDVGDGGGDHRSHPAIGQAALESAHDQVTIVMVNAHGGAVHQFDHRGIDS